MAVVNFPDNPSDGDTQAVGGITYTYSSSKGYWTAAASSGGGGGGGASVTTDDAAPSSPSDGDLWYDTDTGGMFVYYEDADSSQWVEVIGSQGSPGADGAAGAAGADGGAGMASVYATVNDLPTSGNSQGDMAHVTANNTLYFWNGSGWYKIALINTNPSISGVSSSYGLATDGTATVVTVTASDPEGLPITYSIASDTSGNIATVTQGTGASSNVFTVTPSTNTANAGSFTLTFRASDGVNLATAPASFTLQFSVENSNYTTALITSVGANLADNNDFVDSSTNSHTITVAGNATQVSFSPYRHGGYSTYFDGSGDYLTVPSHASMSLDADFTIEYWIYNGTTGNNFMFTLGDSYTSTGFEIYIGSSGSQFDLYSNQQVKVGSASKPTVNAWSHVAAVRSGSTITLYLDGASLGTWTSSDTFSGNLTIGGEYYNGAITGYCTGYLTDVRIVKGTAVYTTGFTPPTERLTSITNTSLLTCHLPYIADGSTNSHAITVNGNTKTTPFAPYDAQEYSSSSHGGSMYFDGNGDGVSAANHTSFDIGSGDFTIETWFYSSNPDNGNIFGKGDSTTASGTSFWMSGGAGSGLYLFHGGSYTIMQTGALPVNQWTHLAFVRNGTNLSTYINGTSVHSTTASITVNTTSNELDIGYYPATAWVGNLEDFRFVKGTAVYTSDFTPPTAPLTAITNTSLLLSGTNAGIIDKSQSIKTLTLNGNVSSSTTQTKYLSSSMAFDGTGDYISTTSEAFGTSDFTVEGWVYFNTNPQVGMGVFQQAGSILPAVSDGPAAGMATSGEWAIYVGSSAVFATTGAAVASTWYHIAYVRNSGTTKFYLNGTQLISATDTTNYTTTSLAIGGWWSTGYLLNGYISDFRITKGLARYTANFTPPAAALKG